MFLLLIFAASPSLNAADMNNILDEYTPRYEVNDPDWTKEEFQNYYIENEIFPAAVDNGVGDKLFKDEVKSHLTKRFPGSTNWTESSSVKSVKNTYGGEPVETDEDDPDIQIMKDLIGINYSALGCGPLSMITQFDYLARHAGYSSIAKYPDETYDKRILIREILENTDVIPSDSWLAKLFGADPNKGTFTFPSEVMSSSREILENHYLAIEKTEINEEDGTKRTFYDRDSQIYVYGDSIPSLSSFSQKISYLKDSIDRGMPVIWWTLSGAGDFGGHYMNIFAYEYWIGKDSSGKDKLHLMFKLRYNWGIDDVYMDSDTLDAVNGGFIYFEETHDKVLIDPEDYGYAQQYYFNELSTTNTAWNNTTFVTKRLRTGRINDTGVAGTGNWNITLSAKRENAGVAYLEYNFSRPIDWIYLDTCWWGTLQHKLCKYSINR